MVLSYAMQEVSFLKQLIRDMRDADQRLVKKKKGSTELAKNLIHHQ